MSYHVFKSSIKYIWYYYSLYLYKSTMIYQYSVITTVEWLLVGAFCWACKGLMAMSGQVCQVSDICILHVSWISFSSPIRELWYHIISYDAMVSWSPMLLIHQCCSIYILHVCCTTLLLYISLHFTLYVGWRSSSKVGLSSLSVLCVVQGKEKISSARHARELMKLKRGTQLG